MKTIEVVAAIIIAKNRILATQRGYGEYKGYWEFPGGKLEEHESKEQALIREINEELNIEILINELFTTVNYDYPSFHLIMHCYICEMKKGERITLIEHEEARWLLWEELETINWLPADLDIIDKLKKYKMQRVE